MDGNFRIFAWVAIIAAFLEIPSMIVSGVRGYLMGAENPLASTFNTVHYYITLPLLTIFLIVLAVGYLLLANKTNNGFLRVMSIIAIVWNAVYFFWDAVLSEHFAWANTFLGALMATVVSGVIVILFGISLLKLKTSYPIAKTAGILYIINGCLLLTMILALISPLLATAIHIVEAILFFRVASSA